MSAASLSVDGARSRPGWRIGVDTGGTFTDVVAVAADGGVRKAKVSSTPPRFEQGILDGIRALGLSPEEVSVIHHGTTVTTNAALTRTGVRTALITTRGFRDVLELRRGNRRDLYDIMWDPPATLVARADRFELDERVDYSGETIRGVDEHELEAIIRAVGKRGIGAVAIVFLHSYANPGNELAVRDRLREALPDVYVTASVEILPQPPEFERTATTVANAYLGPPLIQYLRRLGHGLADDGLRAEVRLMHSGGGVMTVEAATRLPARTAGSGPAAGVMGAAAVGRGAGRAGVISMDMGGTSCDVSVVVDGRARARTQHELEWGLPIRFPSVDFVAIGAGGGSVLWTDAGGSPRCGPASAGARPGPACYQRGGELPTITDANVVLGRLAVDARLARDLSIDADAALAAVRDRFARPLGLEPHEAAAGGVRIANASMASAVRLMTVQKGLDPREFTLIAFGGAGPLHAVDVAREVGIRDVLIPPDPGLISALGLHTVDLVHDLSRSFTLAPGPDRWEAAEATLVEFEQTMRARMAAEGVTPEQVTMTRRIDLRYTGQAHTITVALGPGRFGPEVLAAAVGAFHRAHRREYGYCRAEWPVEGVVLRLEGRAPTAEVDLGAYGDSTEEAAPDRRRDVYFDGDGWRPTDIRSRRGLRPGDRLLGPVVLEDMSSTVLIPPEVAATVDHAHNIAITLTEKASS